MGCFAAYGFVPIQPVSFRQLQRILSQQPLPPDTSPTVIRPVVFPGDQDLLASLPTWLEAAKAQRPGLKVLWLEAKPAILCGRMLEAQRRHLLESEIAGLAEAIRQEQALLAPFRSVKDYAIETSGLTPTEMQAKVARILGIALDRQEPLQIYVTSFGFKRGLPADADLVADVRFLTNPFYEESLRPFTGKDAPIAEYLNQFSETQAFLSQWQSLLQLLIPAYFREGKTRLTVAFGCTGGQHRSVYMAESIAGFLRHYASAQQGSLVPINVCVVHREAQHWPANSPAPATSLRQPAASCSAANAAGNVSSQEVRP